MINVKVKFSKRIAIILLTAIFSVAGITACNGTKDISGSSGDFVSIPEPDNGKTGYTSNLPIWGLDYKPDFSTIFPENSYYEIYAPFITKETNYIVVSYLDTATLNNFWKSHVARAGSNDNIKWIIRDGDNRQSDPKTGNYYYFDKNSDIIYVHQTDNNKYNIKVKEFVGGVIVKYNQDNTGAASQVWTIGGLYKTALNKDENNSQGQQGYAKYNNSCLNEFMRASDNREEGDLSIILMNVGYATVDERYRFQFSYEFGPDQYYSSTDNNYRKDASYFLGKNPSEYYNTKLDKKINHSGDLKTYNFRFTMAESESWWLE